MRFDKVFLVGLTIGWLLADFFNGEYMKGLIPIILLVIYGIWHIKDAVSEKSVQ